MPFGTRAKHKAVGGMCNRQQLTQEMIKYQYAKDENEKLIEINSLNEENRGNSKFFCIGCGNELIARLGKIKAHHFAHKKGCNLFRRNLSSFTWKTTIL
jgi:hypothetical protein